MPQQIEPENSAQLEDGVYGGRSWRFRHAQFMATAIFSATFICLLWLALYFLPAQVLVNPAMPGYKAALGQAIVIIFLATLCVVLSAIAANFIASLLLRCELKRAASYQLVMDWAGLSGQESILGLIRLHELKVYVSNRQTKGETENLPCRLVPLYLLPAYPPGARWALRLFKEVYFDMDELEGLFGSNLDTVRRARPDMLAAEGSLARETEARLKIVLRKEEQNKGTGGRLEAMQNLNDYYKLQAYVLTRLARKFDEKWEKRQTKTEKIVTHAAIQRVTGDILAEQPELKEKLLSLGVKGNPYLPKAMEDFFRHAMPDDMVDWRGGKPSLEDLIGKYAKGDKGSVCDTEIKGNV